MLGALVAGMSSEAQHTQPRSRSATAAVSAAGGADECTGGVSADSGVRYDVDRQDGGTHVRDFYKFACGKFEANHPIPGDQGEVDQFYALYNVNTQSLRGILEKASAAGASRTPDAQKIGDYYEACMDVKAIDSKELAPVQPLLGEIDGLGNTLVAKRDLPKVIGDLQRVGVDVFFGYGEQQDYKDASKQIAFAAQGGLGLPEKDYYLRTGAKGRGDSQAVRGARGEDADACGKLAGPGGEGCRRHHGI